MNQNALIKNQKSDGFGRLLLAALLVGMSVWFFSTERGVFETIPLLVFLPPLAVFLYPHKRIILLFSGAFAILFSLVEKSDFKYTAIYTAVCLAFTGVGMLVKWLITVSLKGDRTKKSLYTSISGVLTILLVMFYILLCGNTIENIAAQNKVKDYIKTQGFTDKLTIHNTYYNYTEGKYLTRVRFADGKNKIEAELSVGKKNATVNGYQNYIEDKLTSAARIDLVDLLNTKFPSDDFATRNGDFQSDGKKPLSLSDDVKDYYGSMRFEIAFYSAFADKKQFTDACSNYYKFLEEKNFIYNTITFYGGNGNDAFLYQMTVTKGLSTEELEKRTLPFDKDSFKTLDREEDYRNHWDWTGK